METYRINVYNIVGGEFCIEADEGQKVFDNIIKALKGDRKVMISFKNVTRVTTAFLNSAVGQLFKDYTEQDIMDKISYEDITDVDKMRVSRVYKNAKLYYEDPESMKKTIEDILGE
jgi:hypothetical protein